MHKRYQKNLGEYESQSGFFETCRRTLAFVFKTAPWLSSLLILSGLLAGAIPFGLSKVTQYLIDVAIKVGSDKTLSLYTAFGGLIVLWAAFKFASDISDDVTSYIRAKWRYKLQGVSEILFITKSAEIDIARHEHTDFQNFRQRAFARGAYVMIELAAFILGSAADIGRLLIGAAVAINFSWKISVILIITQIPSFITTMTFGRRVWGIWDRTSEENRRMQSYREHLWRPIGVIQSKLFQNSQRLISLIKKILEDTEEQFITTEFKRLCWETVATGVRAIGYITAIVAIIESVRAGTVSVGGMTFLIGSIFTFSSAVSGVLSDIGITNEWTLYARDALTFLDLKPYLPKPEHPIKLKFNGAPTISLKNVSFTYHGSDKSTLDIDELQIRPGEKVAVVGLNGAGKTTLMRILTHIDNPTTGSIYVEGVDLRNVESADWQQYLAVLPQNYTTYDMTVRESIAFSDLTRPIDEDDVVKALRNSSALEFVEKWEKGIDAQLGQEFGGKEPSKGQSQKLAVARVLYRKAPVLILDEPTAAVDADSRIAISDSLAALPSDKTLICISHDFAAVRRFDRIIVLKDGKLVEDGSHQKLLSENGEYARMYTEQARALVHDLEELKTAGIQA